MIDCLSPNQDYDSDEDRPTIEDYDEFSEKMAQVARAFDMALREIPAEALEEIKLAADNMTWEWRWEFHHNPGREEITIYLTVDDGIDTSRLGNAFHGWFMEELTKDKDNFIFESLQYMVNTQAKWIRETEERRLKSMEN